MVAQQVIERVSAHYEIQNLELDKKVYRWCPESAVVECECGQKLFLRAFTTTCVECGADHQSTIEEVLDVRPEDKVGCFPWRSLNTYDVSTGGTRK